MIKLFGYELQRCLCNKFFLGLLVVTALYSIQVMKTDIILGVANTAPFSPWSFGTYLVKLLPILLVNLLFFLSFLYSTQEKAVQALTDATPIHPTKFRLLRYGAISVAFIMVLLVPVSYSWWYYGINFHFTAFGTLLVPMFCTLFPAFLFIMGLGALVGRVHPALVFALMPLVLLIGFLPMAGPSDLYGSGIFTNYPYVLGVLDPPFYLASIDILWKCIYSVAGIIMLVLATIESNPLLGRVVR